MPGYEESKSKVGVMVLIRLPLNSKRLTVNHLRQLASKVGVPTTVSPDELCQMIDGKLAEEGRDTPNVQVVLLSAEPDSEFFLEDEEGKFLTVVAVELENQEDGDPAESEGEQPADDLDQGEELNTLRRENQVCCI